MKAASGRRRPTLPGPRLFVRALLAACSCVWIAASPAEAASTVVLVRAPRPTPIAAEATVRLRGELVSAGFEVQVVDAPVGTDVRASLERAAAGPQVEAVVAILASGPGDPGAGTAELWVIDRVTGKTVVRRVPHQQGAARAAEILSVRALELLRASFLEVALTAAGRPVASASSPAGPMSAPTSTPSPAPILPSSSSSSTSQSTSQSSSQSSSSPSAPPEEVTRWTDQALTEALQGRWTAPSTWAFEVGGAVRGGFEGMEPSLMPLARIQHLFAEHLVARVTVAGLGTRVDVSRDQLGTAQVTQQLLLLDGVARWNRGRRWQPFVSLGAGVLHVNATGQTQLPYEGLSNDRWALLLDAGVGVQMAFRGRFAFGWELHVQAANPYPTIRFINQDVAREGRPTLMSTLTLLAWL